MQIKFLGAAGTVTGSSYVLTSGSGKSILIDLGMFQGIPEVEKLNYEPFDYNCANLMGAILTHAHLDHSGRVPILMSHGFKGNIWMTPPTRELTEISLYDTVKIARDDAKKMLFDQKEAVSAILRFNTVEYRTPFQVGDFTINFRDAGHILGSATVEVTDKNPNSEIKKIVFSGDLGNPPEDMLMETEMIDSADAVIMESTYGDRLHPAGSPIEKITSEINEIEKSGGTLLIPTFSLDRTQELLHIIMHLKKEGKVKGETPIYMDSPMAEKTTKVYVEYPHDMNQHIQNDLKIGDIFSFPGLTVVETGGQSRFIHETTGPKVIIAGSGMMSGGRIRGHAAYYLSIPDTRLLIVGYQAVGTLGRVLLGGAKQVYIDGVNVLVNATISETQAMSSHADQNELMKWIKHIKDVKKIFLTHGEDEPRKVLQGKIKNELGIKDIMLPVLNQEIEI